MTSKSNGWLQAFSAFLDRRALIMLFLGFSAGIPILLIFSSLSLWLGEAGISRSTVTMFSWAALGYSFKFVWAPLIDELSLPYLTKKLGRRRSWLLVAQILIICGICIMAMTNPAAVGQSLDWQLQFGSWQVFHLYIENTVLIQMAMGAVILGFASATQDIVIDAYRIELAEAKMQTVLASTYNAGYRIGMIIAGAGALFIAAGLGTAKGNYIYSAWQTTYFIMAATMLVGIITTLCIPEPKVERVYKDYERSDYLRLVLVFFSAVASFVVSFIYLGKAITGISINDPFLSFMLEATRFIGAGVIAVLIGFSLVKVGAVNRQMALETWVSPIADFFKRYGLKLALVLLLLIGFYRISDIIAGVISNVFYQDMNFSKEQIAEAVKIYGVIFTLIGGFLGGLLSQRFNIMKVMFIGAILASSTNLIFVGLVKSGAAVNDVTVQIGNQTYQVPTDEVGYWKVDVPRTVLVESNKIITNVSYQNQQVVQQNQMPYLMATKENPLQISLFALTRDGVLTDKELRENVLVEGQVASFNQIAEGKSVQLSLGTKTYSAIVDVNGKYSTTIPADDLKLARNHYVVARIDVNEYSVLASQSYQIATHNKDDQAVLNNLIDPISVHAQEEYMTTVSGKVVKEYSKWWLYFAIIMDNLASGMAGAAFIAFLSSLTSVSFTAVQYAIFSSLMTLTPKILGGYSGTIVTNIGYPNFFLMTTLIGLPILILVVWVAKLLNQHEKKT